MSYHERIFGRAEGKNPLSIRSETPGIGGGGGSHEEARERNQESNEAQLCSGFDILLQELRKNPEDLQKRIDMLKELPESNNVLGKIYRENYFTEEHWEIAATLRFYDQKTFNHSLRVLQCIYEMATDDGETATYLKKRMAIENPHDEHMAFQDLFAAAFFHDIGKTAIPKKILHDHRSRRDWARDANIWAKKIGRDLYFDEGALQDPEQGGLEEAKLDDYFTRVRQEKDYEPLSIVPLHEVFDDATLRELEMHGIEASDTFRRVLERHESATRAILRRKKMYISADIASHHHDYEKRPIRLERYPTEISAVRIGFELSILRSIDIYDALTSDDREYKHPHHPLLALEILVREAEAEFTELELTKYVVRDLYKKLEASQKNTPRDEKEGHALSVILEFIQ